jgi:hypothetical protein
MAKGKTTNRQKDISRLLRDTNRLRREKAGGTGRKDKRKGGKGNG